MTIAELRDHIKDMPDDVIVVFRESDTYYDMSLPILRDVRNDYRDQPEYHGKQRSN